MKDSKEKKTYNQNRQIALCGVMIALAMVLSYLESLVPISFAVPGVKLGLANLVTILAIYRLDLRQTFVISLCRIVLSGLLFTSLLVIVYSLAGACLSILVMVLLKKVKIFTMTGVSVSGAIAHNVGQLIVAAILLENANILYYIAVLAISGTIAGVCIGLLASIILKNIRF